MPSHDSKTMKRYKGTLLLYLLVANWDGLARPRIISTSTNQTVGGDKTVFQNKGSYAPRF